MRRPRIAVAVLLAGCASAPPSPEQARLDACLAKKFVACMQGRTPATPTVR